MHAASVIITIANDTTEYPWYRSLRAPGYYVYDPSSHRYPSFTSNTRWPTGIYTISVVMYVRLFFVYFLSLARTRIREIHISRRGGGDTVRTVIFSPQTKRALSLSLFITNSNHVNIPFHWYDNISFDLGTVLKFSYTINIYDAYFRIRLSWLMKTRRIQMRNPQGTRYTVIPVHVIGSPHPEWKIV